MSVGWGINPVTLKELRQLTRSRLVASGLIAFLFLQVAGVALALLWRDPDELASGGRSVFHTLYFLLSGALLFCVTGYTGTRFALERGNEHLDLQFTTALSPRQFVDGKVAAALVLTALFGCASLPFFVLSYLLRGLDVLRVLGAIALLTGAAVCCLYGVVLLAVAASTRSLRALFLLLAAGGLCLVMAGVNAAGREVATSGWLSLRTPGEWLVLAAAVAGGATGCALVRAMAVALLSPSHANRDWPVRVWLMGAWLFWGACAVAAVMRAARNAEDFLSSWAFLGVFVAGVMMAVAASERPGYSRRVLAGVSRNRFARWGQFFFFSGAANGLAWACLLGALTVILAGPLDAALPAGTAMMDGGDSGTGQLTAFFFYLSAYVCTVRALWRFLLGRWLPYKFAGLCAGVLVALGGMLPYLLNINGAITAETDFAWQLGNAFAVFSENEAVDLPAHLAFAGAWAAAAWLACAPELAAAWRAFRKKET
jgi:hypothetical protein